MAGETVRDFARSPAAIRLVEPASQALDRPLLLSILGATGSIGENTLELVGRAPDRFQIVALTAQSNAHKLAELAIAHRARVAVIGDPSLYGELKSLLEGSGIEVGAGEAALVEAASREVDCVMAAIVGAAGLKPTFAATAHAKRVALANKECLVSAGEVFLSAVRQNGAELIPVDSEHSAALQALTGAPACSIERIVLTASGGPFRTFSAEALAQVTPEQALRHPNWSMGAKITIDSATLMNKGLEIIEAYHLFPVSADQLDAVIHPQSIVHCLVAFVDGSMLAQMASPDMRTPIAQALSWPARSHTPTRRVDLVALGSLTFEAVDHNRFPALILAKEALKRAGAAPAVLNAANEIAVAAFLDRRLRFLDIPVVVREVLEQAESGGFLCNLNSLADVLDADGHGRRLARAVVAARAM